MNFDWLVGIPDLALDYLAQLILLAVVTFLLPHAYRLLKIKADDSRRAAIESALQNGIKWAIAQAIAAAAAKSASRGASPHSKSPYGLLSDPLASAKIVSDAKSYVNAGVPSAVKHLKIGDDALQRAVEARLPTVAAKVVTEAEQARLL